MVVSLKLLPYATAFHHPVAYEKQVNDQDGLSDPMFHVYLL